MANIHRIGDCNDNPARSSQAASQPPNNGTGPSIFQMMGDGGDGAGGSMYPPIKKVLAPNYTPKSFIFIISVIQIVLFVFELIVGATLEDGAFVRGNDMAGPSSATLKLMGGIIH